MNTRWWIAAFIVWTLHILVVAAAGYWAYQYWPQVWDFLKFCIFPVGVFAVGFGTIMWAFGVYYDD